ncbi:MAG: hypothetical protein K6C32_03595, partial [Bacilli bacterium]|nr:hypothetical protein [Bacilli bacterium]
MKNNVLKIVTLFGITPLLMGATVLPDLLPSVNVDTDYIGPYSYHQSDQSISFTVTFKNYGTVNGVFERIVVETDTYPNAYISKKKVHNIESDSPYTVSFTIPTSELYGDEPMKLTFTIMNASKTYCTRSFSIQPVSSATISPFDYKKNKYELGPFAAKLSGIYITECKETFKFAN